MSKNEKNDLPCIYGVTINPRCSVRDTLAQEQAVDKTIMSKNAMAQQMKEFVIAGAPHLIYQQLTMFCTLCPFLRKYNEEVSLKLSRTEYNRQIKQRKQLANQ